MTTVEQLQTSSAELERACALLISPAPETLDECSLVLDRAARRLAELQPALDGARGDAEALAQAWKFRRNVRRAGALLAKAAGYHAGWRQWVQVRSAGYGPDGAPCQMPQAGRLCVRG